MNEMVERVARALITSFNTAPALPRGAGSAEFTVSVFHRAAEDAIEAMREPTDAMCKRSDDWRVETSRGDIWRAMIDAALSEE